MKRRVIEECLRIAVQNNLPHKHPQWDCYHHFSFIIQRNRIIDWGTNRSGTPITAVGYEPWQKIHSEFDAWRKARGIMIKNLPFSVVNIRLTKTGLIRDSKPCQCCFNFLKNLGCKEVAFSLDIGTFAEIRF